MRLKTGHRDAPIVLLLAVLVVVVTVTACGKGNTASQAGNSGPSIPLPAGWREIGRPITGVLYPKQVFAAATYPIVFHHKPRSCFPKAALRQMPADGILLQLIEYSPADSTGKPVRVPVLPSRPHRFSYADATYAMFECAGPSYKFDFEQRSRAFQAQVWFNRKTVEPRFRAEALQILDSLHQPRTH
ncbi:MAG: hypothetical protein ACM3N0_07630 [Chloroflexota bacterium]